MINEKLLLYLVLKNEIQSYENKRFKNKEDIEVLDKMYKKFKILQQEFINEII